jgi:hypothetical protein
VAWCVTGKATVPILCGVQETHRKDAVAVNASIAQITLPGTADRPADAAVVEDALSMEHGQIEQRVRSDGMEMMRLVTQAHLDLRAVREEHVPVTDADGDARVTAEDRQDRTRIMIFGPVVTSRTAYRRRGKKNLYPQDAELNWAGHSYSAGIITANAKAAAVLPYEKAAAQVSRGVYAAAST